MIKLVAILSLMTSLAVDPPREPQSGASGSTQPAARKSLGLGDKAPPLSVDYWIKGEEIVEFESGKAYVIGFWATWSPPCRKSIGLVTEFAKKYPSIRFVGIASLEKPPEKDREDSRLKNVMTFVEEKGDQMLYTVAYDGDETMNLTWRDPAGQSGIPVAFVVDGRGRIAWIGNPTSGLDAVLAKVAAGKYDVDRVKQIFELKRKANAMLENKQFEEALAVLEEMYRLEPENIAALTLKFNTLLMKLNDPERASAFGNECINGAFKDNAAELEQIMRAIVLTPGISQRDFGLAIKAGERAQAVSGVPSAAALEVLAKAYKGAGDNVKAIATLEKAIKASEGTFRDVLSDTLLAWKKEPAKK